MWAQATGDQEWAEAASFRSGVPLRRMLPAFAVPVEWLCQFRHRRGALSLAFSGAFSLTTTLPVRFVRWSCLQPEGHCAAERSLGWIGTHAAFGAAALLLAALLSTTTVSPRASEGLLSLAHIVQVALSSWNLTSRFEFTVLSCIGAPFLGFCLVLAGVPAQLFVAVALADMVNLLVPSLQHGWLHGQYFTLAIMPFLAICVAGAKHMHWKALHDAQQLLAAETEALEALLSMVCDAECWLDADGKTILRSDARLDGILGSGVEGARLLDYMAPVERKRFQEAMAAAMGLKERRPVHLLPATLCRPHGRPVDVDLFLVGRRAGAGMGCCAHPQGNSARSIAAHAARHAGFLVGVKLAVSPCPSPQRSVPDTQPSGLGSHPAARLPSDSDDAEDEQPDLGNLPTISEELARNPGKLERSETPDGSVASVSRSQTLKSLSFRSVQVCTTSKAEIREAVCGRMQGAGASFVPVLSGKAQTTVLAALDLVCDHARGGALVCVAETEAFREVFPNMKEQGPDTRRATPSLRVSDGYYMTNRLKGVHVTDARFAVAFSEFTEHGDGDRWPLVHPDPCARGQPKDGAFLLSASGYRLKCAVKLLGISCPCSWPSVGTKHEAALACAWNVRGCCVLVRSEAGSVHLIVRRGDAVYAHLVESAV